MARSSHRGVKLVSRPPRGRTRAAPRPTVKPMFRRGAPLMGYAISGAGAAQVAGVVDPTRTGF